MKASINKIADLGLPLIYQADTAVTPAYGTPNNQMGDAVRTVVTSLSGFQKEAFVTSARTGTTWRMVSDEGKNLNGNDAAPPPLGFLAVGMIASYMTEISALAEIRGVTINDLRLKMDNYYSMTGSMPRKTMVGGALPVELTVDIDCSLQGSALNQFLIDAVTASSLNGLLRGHLDSLFRLARNGTEIAPADKKAPDLALLPEATTAALEFGIIHSDDVLLDPLGPSPSAASVGSKASGAYSVKDAKGTLIHVGTSATYRADGIKEIRQQLYSPNGTEWHFLSDEAIESGGQGRAPDANAYVAAGIGFCFMTQFGILIDVHKLDVERYQILQDMHFSLGGASGKTGKAGDAGAVETHVHLMTGESDDVAQELLFLAEQSCFLHALCRSELKTKLHVKTALVT